MSSKTIVVRKAVRPASHIAPLPAKAVKKSDPVVQCWRVLMPIRVADKQGSETSHMRQYGDYVPEAATWKNVGTYLRTQHLEIVYLAKSELQASLDMMYERFEQEDEEKVTAENLEEKKRELLRQLRELEAEASGEGRAKTRPANSHHEEREEKTKVEKIDLGGLPKQGGMPKPVPLPRAVREIPVVSSTPGSRPPKVGRTVRKV